VQRANLPDGRRRIYLGSGGNIVAAGGARAVNSVVHLQLDSSRTTPTWFEITG